MKELLAKWQSRGGRWSIDLFVEFADGKPPMFSYSGNDCGGFMGAVAPEVAMQHAAQQASYCPSKMPRIFYSESVAQRCCLNRGRIA